MIEILIPAADLGLKVQRRKHQGRQGVEVIALNLDQAQATADMLKKVAAQLEALHGTMAN